MNKLKTQIKRIPKTYFSINDLYKISNLDKASLKVALTRLVNQGKILRLTKGWYTSDLNNLNWENLAVNIYTSSYISFESALNYYNILSQQSLALTLATTRRKKEINIHNKVIMYRHVKPELFWGYKKQDDYLIATKEKAFLDLAYLSLYKHAHFDPEEMNLDLLNQKIIKKYLFYFNHKQLNKLIKSTIKV